MRALSTGDILFTQLEKRQQPMHIGGLFLFKLPEDAHANFVYDLVQDIMKSKKLPIDPFNRVLHRGLFWKEDDDFEIDHHFRHIALPKPGRIRELLVYVSQEHSSLLERAKPLWECHIIEGIEGNRFALYFKMHHAVVDGIAAIRLVKKSLSKSANERNNLPFWSMPREKREPQTDDKPENYSLDVIKSQLQTLPNVSKELLNNIKNFNNPAFVKPYQTPSSILNQKITSARRVACQSYDIVRFKKIATHFDMKINDVVLAVCSGVLRNYLISQRALPKKSLTAFVPMSLRTDSTDTGNQIAFMLASLATDISDPVERIKAINNSVNENKARFARMTQKEIINYCLIFYSLTTLNLVTSMLPKHQGFNLIISNVPGSKDTLYWNGAKLDALYPLSVLMDGQAMNITFASYEDKIEFGIVANTRALPRIQNMLELIENEISLYEELLTINKLSHEQATQEQLSNKLRVVG